MAFDDDGGRSKDPTKAKLDRLQKAINARQRDLNRTAKLVTRVRFPPPALGLRSGASRGATTNARERLGEVKRSLAITAPAAVRSSSERVDVVASEEMPRDIWPH